MENYSKYRQYEHDRLQHGWKIDDVYKIVYELEQDYPTGIEQRTFLYVADNLKTLDKHKIISLCNEYKGIENWAYTIFSVNDYIKALGENGGIVTKLPYKEGDDFLDLKTEIKPLKEYEWQWFNTHGSVILNAEGVAKAILSIFKYYYSDLEPDYFLQTLSGDTLNNERADEQPTGGEQVEKPQPTPTPAALNLPDELATPEAEKYFSRAVEKGYMTITENGATWNKSQVECGFVCSRIYVSNIPRTRLSKYFGLFNLSASITQAEYDYILYKDKNATLKDSVKQWIERTNKDVFFD